jgi:formylglycine-generating enzyme required for sulfatase activity
LRYTAVFYTIFIAIFRFLCHAKLLKKNEEVKMKKTKQEEVKNRAQKTMRVFSFFLFSFFTFLLLTCTNPIMELARPKKAPSTPWDLVSKTGHNLRWIPAGTFTMGSPTDESGHRDDEIQHQVTLTKGFYMGKYPVTQAQYQAVMGKTIEEQQALAGYPSNYGRGNHFPMYFVRWYDAIVFCNKLSMKEGLSPAYRISGSTDPALWGAVPTSNLDAAKPTWDAVQIVEGSNGYRLPTEAQWEYACRAGTTTAFNWGTNTIDSTQANYNNTLNMTTEVGSFAPNAWGLYDMHGNVYEWCWDWYGTYASGALTDPTGPVSGFERISRGGTFNAIGMYLRSAYRSSDYPSNWQISSGFRVVRP